MTEIAEHWQAFLAGVLFCAPSCVVLGFGRGGITMVDKSNRYTYRKPQYDFAKELIDDLYAELDDSEDEWDRGFNSGIRFVIHKLRRYTSEVERDLGMKAEG